MAETLSQERCFLLLGEAPTAEAAEKIAEVFAACPYVYFMSAFGRIVVGVYFLEEDHRWWLEAVAEDPEGTLGLTRAALYVTDRAAFPPGMALRLPAERGDLAPCGSDCTRCPRYGDPCPGCPASRHFQG
ncbi:MAG: hypothetical protein NUV94_00335 [Candidatus Acetothermia bacterium]|jgi:hypothetical protein|nr:hypothetical protein [Candidatus Acetothermia bacterium]